MRIVHLNYQIRLIGGDQCVIQSFIPELSVYFGHYLTHTVTLPRVNHDKKITEFVKVLKTEEKGSDVNLALHVLNDAWLNKYDCAVIVSNDSDLAESLRLIKHHHKKVIGLITPGDPKIRKPSRMLSQYADFTKPIRKGVLAVSQLPDTIPGTNLTKPNDWK